MDEPSIWPYTDQLVGVSFSLWEEISLSTDALWHCATYPLWSLWCLLYCVAKALSLTAWHGWWWQCWKKLANFDNMWNTGCGIEPKLRQWRSMKYGKQVLQYVLHSLFWGEGLYCQPGAWAETSENQREEMCNVLKLFAGLWNCSAAFR